MEFNTLFKVEHLITSQAVPSKVSREPKRPYVARGNPKALAGMSMPSMNISKSSIN